MIERRAWRGRTVGKAALILLASSRAAASPHLQAVGESSLGYTDNVQSAAQAQSGATDVRTKLAFLMLSPGLVLALASPRGLQRLSYRYEYDFYLNATSSSSSSNRLDYRGFFELSPKVNLVLGGNVMESDRFNAVAFAPPGAGVVGALPTGTGSFLRAAADEAFSF